MVTIHYFFDPMCGWCFGATPLAEILFNTPNVNLVLHPGGMIKRREMDDSFRMMAQDHDKEIALQTGQLFSQAYHKKLASDETIVLDSYITAQAISVMEKLNNKGFEMLKAIQQAHYQYALDVSEPNTLAIIAKELGIEESQWLSLMALGSLAIKHEMQKSHSLMKHWGIRGFPTFIMEGEDKLDRLPHTNYYAEPEKWKNFIEQL